jgi:hypothetical protein
VHNLEVPAAKMKALEYFKVDVVGVVSLNLLLRSRSASASAAALAGRAALA